MSNKSKSKKPTLINPQRIENKNEQEDQSYDQGILGPYLTLEYGWEVSPYTFPEITEETVISHPDLPGIAIRAFDLDAPNALEIFTMELYTQAVEYGRSRAKILAKAKKERKKGKIKGKKK